MRRAMRIHRGARGWRALKRSACLLRLLFALGILLLSREAHAYPWMVRHGYSGCAPCHLDPSGGGVLTAYGRTVGGLVMRTRYAEKPDEPSSADDFLFGAVPLPAELMLGGDARGLLFASKVEGVKTRHDFLLMQADLAGAVAIEHVIASASIGYAETGAFSAALTRAPEKNLVSRVHWAGYELDATSGLIVRAGRMNLPFGISYVEHTLWTRAETET